MTIIGQEDYTPAELEEIGIYEDDEQVGMREQDAAYLDPGVTLEELKLRFSVDIPQWMVHEQATLPGSLFKVLVPPFGGATDKRPGVLYARETTRLRFTGKYTVLADTSDFNPAVPFDQLEDHERSALGAQPKVVTYEVERLGQDDEWHSEGVGALWAEVTGHSDPSDTWATPVYGDDGEPFSIAHIDFLRLAVFNSETSLNLWLRDVRRFNSEQVTDADRKDAIARQVASRATTSDPDPF